jgi:hypothetical protein
MIGERLPKLVGVSRQITFARSTRRGVGVPVYSLIGKAATADRFASRVAVLL